MNCCRHFRFLGFFSQNTWFIFVESFNIIRPAVLFFGQNHQKKSHFWLQKIFVAKHWYFSIYTKKSPLFVEKWAKTKCLLLNIFLLLNFHCLTYSALGRNWVSPKFSEAKSMELLCVHMIEKKICWEGLRWIKMSWDIQKNSQHCCWLFATPTVYLAHLMLFVLSALSSLFPLFLQFTSQAWSCLSRKDVSCISFPTTLHTRLWL